MRPWYAVVFASIMLEVQACRVNAMTRFDLVSQQKGVADAWIVAKRGGEEA